MKEFVFIWFKSFPAKLVSIRQGCIRCSCRKKAEKKLERLYTNACILYENGNI